MTIFFAEYFKARLRRLLKKYPHADEDLLDTLEKLKIENEILIGRSIYKVRVRSSDLKKGKSGGFMAYIYFYGRKELLVPLCIYSKSDQVSISENESQYHFDKVIEDLLREKV